MRKVLTIAGSDCSGGAGIQADLKTFSAYGVYGMSAVVSVVAENSAYVSDIHNIPIDIIKKQIDCIFDDMGADVVKMGMLSDAERMEAVAERLHFHKPAYVVCDPVMYAKNGARLMDAGSVETLISKIAPLADVITPNIHEAEVMAEVKIANVQDMLDAAKIIHEKGCKNVVLKGGYFAGEKIDTSFSKADVNIVNISPETTVVDIAGCVKDVFYDGKAFTLFLTPYYHNKFIHGAGCTFSAAIAAALAKGMSMIDAVTSAEKYITNAIKYGIKHGKGNYVAEHTAGFRNE